MTERPILFSAPMVRALLAGRKTQTRRRYKPRYPEPWEVLEDGWPWIQDEYGDWFSRVSPYGEKGDRLWVRETFSYSDGHVTPKGTVQYRANVPRADEVPGLFTWKPSIFMRRLDSRITLEVTDLRVQRLHEISEDDAVAEGTPCRTCGGRVDGTSENDCECFHTRDVARSSYESLWNEINGAGSWEANPYVWCISFRVVQP